MSILPSPIQEIHDQLFQQKGVRVFVKREDLIHPVIMGNKWRKLKYNLNEAKDRGFKGLVTMGGAFSNHILATASAAKEFDLESRAIIRGNELGYKSNPTLRKSAAYGMQFEFVSRDQYRSYRENTSLIQEKYPDNYFLPEGGTNALAIRGCQEIIDEIDMDYDYICTSIGTGGTLAGLIRGISQPKTALGFSALKGDFVFQMIKDLLNEHRISNDNYQVFDQYHFGGYAKFSDQLAIFINRFKEKHQILLDPVYTGKMFYGVIDLIKQDFFKFNQRIILVHTGGIQGIEGYNLKNRRKIS